MQKPEKYLISFIFNGALQQKHRLHHCMVSTIVAMPSLSASLSRFFQHFIIVHPTLLSVLKRNIPLSERHASKRDKVVQHLESTRGKDGMVRLKLSCSLRDGIIGPNSRTTRMINTTLGSCSDACNTYRSLRNRVAARGLHLNMAMRVNRPLFVERMRLPHDDPKSEEQQIKLFDYFQKLVENYQSNQNEQMTLEGEQASVEPPQHVKESQQELQSPAKETWNLPIEIWNMQQEVQESSGEQAQEYKQREQETLEQTRESQQQMWKPPKRVKKSHELEMQESQQEMWQPPRQVAMTQRQMHKLPREIQKLNKRQIMSQQRRMQEVPGRLQVSQRQMNQLSTRVVNPTKQVRQTQPKLPKLTKRAQEPNEQNQQPKQRTQQLAQRMKSSLHHMQKLRQQARNTEQPIPVPRMQEVLQQQQQLDRMPRVYINLLYVKTWRPTMPTCVIKPRVERQRFCPRPRPLPQVWSAPRWERDGEDE